MELPLHEDDSDAEEIEEAQEMAERLHDTNPEEPEEMEILPFHLTYLTPALIEQAKTELNETEEIKQRSLHEFRNFIQQQKNFVSPTDDMFLLAFLRARKYDLKKSYKLFLSYWEFQKDYSSIFDNINAEQVRALLFRNFLGYLEHRDKRGSLVLVIKFGQWDPEIDNMENMIIAFSAIYSYSLDYHASQIAGIRGIVDLRGVTWNQLKYATPPNLALFIRSTQFCFPARVKGIHILSKNKVFVGLWKIARPFFTNKLRERVFLHDHDLKPLQQYIHPSVLPVEFGGEAPAFETTKWKDYILQREEQLLQTARCGFRKS